MRLEKLPTEIVIRTAAVRNPTIGYIFACDPTKEEDEPHTYVYKWENGLFNSGECNYNAHSICIIREPDYALVDISEQGYYALTSASVQIASDLLDDSRPLPNKPRLGGFRSITEIGGKAYAVGLRGMVYRLDKLLKEKGVWTRIDEGLPNTFNVQAIHGFNASDIYAVGRNGEVWHYDGKRWKIKELPTNINLYSVKCVEDGKVYLAGNDGLLISGRDDIWEVIEHETTEDNICDIEWFEGKLYVSTRHGVYWLDNSTLVSVNFGEDKPATCYQLSKAEGVMWSNGEHDIMSFDGEKWTRIV